MSEYRLGLELPDAASQAATINDSTPPVQFKVPALQLRNWSRTRLELTETPDAAGASNYIRLFANTLSLINRITLRAQSGPLIADVQDIQNAMNMLWPREFTQAELNQLPVVEPGTTSPTQFFQCNNRDLYAVASTTVAISGTTAAEGSPIVATATPAFMKNIRCKRPDNTDANRTHSEMLYFWQGSSANSATPVLVCSIPLGMLLGTFFSKDIDIPQNDTWILTVYFGTKAKCGFIGTSVSDPSSGAAALTTNIALSGLQLRTAEVKNPMVRDAAFARLNGEGMKILYPHYYLRGFNFNSAGTSKNFIQKISSVDGRRVVRVYWTLWNNTESSNTAYDHDCLSSAKVISYTTKVDGTVEQPLGTWSLADNDDWKSNKALFQGSCIQDANQHYYNWVHVSDFSGNQHLWEDYCDQPRGLDLSVEKTYQGSMTTANVAGTVYVLYIVQKEMELKGNTIIVDV